MQDLRELYQEVIIDHSRQPRNCHENPHATHQAEGFNRLCGDRLTLYLEMETHTVKDISFVGCGCAIAMASASLMTEQVKGKTQQEAELLLQRFHQFVTNPEQTEQAAAAGLGKLAVLAGVRAYPTRVKCATLAWHTLQAAFKHQVQPVSTED